MTSTDNPDPIADWFKRHRVKLALIVLVVILLGRLPELIEGTTRGLVEFVYAAAFFGLLTWGWGSRQDRSEATYWLKFAALWTAFLVTQIGMVLISLALDNAFQGRWLVPIVLVALLALAHWMPYRRIRNGKPFPARRA